MQSAVKHFVDEYDLSCGVSARCIDLMSELGELGKEILKSTAYGGRPFEPNEAIREEAGDCLFSLLALLCEMGVDAQEALAAALAKYERRFASSASISSGR